MAQPTPYTRTTDFSQQEANNASGRSTVNTAAVDAELDAILLTLTEMLSNIALIQRDDGELRNLSVHVNALSATVRLLISSGAFTIDSTDAAWVTATAYSPGRVVSEGSTAYLCVVAHTSGTFSTDLAAGKWIDIAPVRFTAAAEDVEFTPGGTLSSTNLQTVVEELNREVRPAADLYMASTYGAL